MLSSRYFRLSLMYRDPASFAIYFIARYDRITTAFPKRLMELLNTPGLTQHLFVNITIVTDSQSDFEIDYKPWER